MEQIEYEHEGEDIVIHYKEEASGDSKYDKHSAWVDGGTKAVYLDTLFENKDKLPDDITSGLPDKQYDANEEQLRSIMNFLAENNLVVCKCGNFFDKDKGGRKKFAGVICPVCVEENKTCDAAEDGEHDWKCLNPKHSARVSTKYECENCGQEKETVPTG